MRAELLAAAALLAAASSWAAPSFTLATDAGSAAQFDWVSYDGRDPATDKFPATKAQYRNPIIPGFQPDPSIVRVRDDYYLINSSFAFFPGIPVFHSRDLINWRQIGNAIERPEQFNFSGLGIARAIFAPTIRWHDGVFYIVGTCEDCGFNFIMSAIDPAGPWSNPTWLQSIDGVDPDLFVDVDGRAWIANNGPPPQAPMYEGHRAIWLQEIDLTTRKMVGSREVVVDGGVDIAQHPIWIEGPHLIRKASWYYLIAAEGGTAGGHSEVVFRSEKVTGPYIPAPGNPILTQRDLNPNRPFPIAAAGHADFVLTQDGGWWSVFLATRPYEANLSNLGRETFLLPVDWQHAWPRVLPSKTAVPHVLLRPPLPSTAIIDRSHWRERFDSNKLSPDWEMLRTPRTNWYRLGKKTGTLILQARAESISGSGNPSFLAKRQRHQNAVVETEVRYVPVRTGDRAGLVVFADERHHYFLGLWETQHGPQLVVAVRNGAADPDDGRIIAAAPYTWAPGGAVRLQASACGANYDFAYAIGRGPWIQLLANADGRMLASELTNLFTGTMLGVYAARTPVSQ